MSILILGTSDDAHALQVYHALEAQIISAVFVDTRQFPTQLQLSWQPKLQAGTLQLPSGNIIETEKIQSIYWRAYRPAEPKDSGDRQKNRLAQRDCETMLRTFLQLPHIQWVNGWEAYQYHRDKPLQLHTVHQLGIPIPTTLVGNDPDSIRTFAATHENVIFRPLHSGAQSKWLNAIHLTPEYLNQALQVSPVALQNYIEGTNIRVFVIGSTLFAWEIRSSALDFRYDSKRQLIPIELPERIKKQSLAIANKLQLKWTAIDWRKQIDDTYFFLDAHPNPNFIQSEILTGYPITQTLTDLLTQPPEQAL